MLIQKAREFFEWLVISLAPRRQFPKFRAHPIQPLASTSRYFFNLKSKNASTVTVPFLKPYNPKNVGNDASARPWESLDLSQVHLSLGSDQLSTMRVLPDVTFLAGQPTVKTLKDLPYHDLPQAWSEGLPFNQQNWSRFETRASLFLTSGLDSQDLGDQGWPLGFDVSLFLSMAQKHFLLLQEAWDRRDLLKMQDYLSISMLEEVKAQFSHLTPPEPSQSGHQVETGLSEVLMLESQFLSIKSESQEYRVSVELSGMVREVYSASPNPFREIWTWSKALTPHHEFDLEGWRVCALEALQ
jgi:Tim44-like domain